MCVTCYRRARRADEANNRVLDNKDKLARQDQQLSDYEAELNLLRRRCESLQNDHDRDKKEIARLQDALNRARIVRHSSLMTSLGYDVKRVH